MKTSPTDKKNGIGKLPPQSIEAEMSLLGSLMLDKDAIVKVVDFLEPRDFYKGIHQTLYQVMQELFEKTEPIDLLSVSSRLKEKEKLDSIGGHSYLTELINTIPTASHVMSYAKIVQKKRILRDLISASQEIELMGYDEEEDPDILLDHAEAQIFSIAQKSLAHSFVNIKDTLEEAFDRYDKLHKGDKATRGVPTGLTDLDKTLSGLQKSDLIILAARPSLGKSSLAVDIGRRIAGNEKLPVAIFSLEMAKDQIVDRIIAMQANVDLWRLRTGQFSTQNGEDDFTRIQLALGSLAETPIFIDDTPGQSILQMRAMARRLKMTQGLGLIIVDYLQLMQPRNTLASPVQQITEISRSLKGLARELDVPVLALSQLSRAVEQRIPPRPRLSDLRDSGSIEQDADVVLFIYREDRYKENTPNKNIAEIIIAKHRNGPVGSIRLFFNENTTSFSDLAQNVEYNEAPASEEFPF